MGRYNFVSPLAAGGNALVDTLTSRRDEERRRLLDEIANKNSEVSRRATEENIKASEERRLNSEVDDVASNLEVGDDLSQIDPRILEVFKRRGLTGQRKQDFPQVDTSTSFAAPDGMGDFVTQGGDMDLPGAFTADNKTISKPKPPSPTHSNFFTGNPEQRQRERVRDNVGKVISSLGDPNIGEMERMMSFYQALEGDHVPAGLWDLFEPSQSVVTFDEADGSYKDPSGKVISNLPKNAKVVTRNRPPAGPQPQFFTWVDKDGKPKSGWLRPGENPPDGARKGNQPIPKTGGVGGKAGPILTDSTQKKLSDLSAAYNKSGAQADSDKLFEYALGAVESANVMNESIREAVRQIMSLEGTPQADPRSAEEIAEEMAQDPEATAAEVAQFTRLLRQVRRH